MRRHSGKPAFLACGATDMRKSADGLAALVRAAFSLDPFAASLFVFCNRRRDRLKILEQTAHSPCASFGDTDLSSCHGVQSPGSAYVSSGCGQSSQPPETSVQRLKCAPRFNLEQVKIEWDGNGFWLHYKRLEKGHFKWPSEGAGPVLELSSEELSVLLGGAKVELKLRRVEVRERAA